MKFKEHPKKYNLPNNLTISQNSSYVGKKQGKERNKKKKGEKERERK